MRTPSRQMPREDVRHELDAFKQHQHDVWKRSGDVVAAMSEMPPQDPHRSGNGEVDGDTVIRALAKKRDLAAAVKIALHATPIVGPWIPIDRPLGDSEEAFERRDVTGLRVSYLKSQTKHEKLMSDPPKFRKTFVWTWELNVPVPSADGGFATTVRTGPRKPSMPAQVTDRKDAFGRADMDLLAMTPTTLFLDPEDYPGKPPLLEPKP